jgi:hypothetical protein
MCIPYYLQSSFADPHYVDANLGSCFPVYVDPDPTSPFFPHLDPPMLQNDPRRLPPFHIDADLDPDPAFNFDLHALLCGSGSGSNFPK